VNGVSGNDNYNCEDATTACKTIGHAISLASSGDTIMVAAATYTEDLTIGKSLKMIGAGLSAARSTTIIDGGGVSTAVTISRGVGVTLSGFTIQHGAASNGGGIYNDGKLMLQRISITGNSAGSGGGIFNNGTLMISISNVSGNVAGCICP